MSSEPGSCRAVHEWAARVRACNPVVRAKLLNCSENRKPGHVLSNNGLCLRTAVQYVVTVFSTHGKFRPVSNFT